MQSFGTAPIGPWVARSVGWHAISSHLTFRHERVIPKLGKVNIFGKNKNFYFQLEQVQTRTLKSEKVKFWRRWHVLREIERESHDVRRLTQVESNSWAVKVFRLLLHVSSSSSHTHWVCVVVVVVINEALKLTCQRIILTWTKKLNDYKWMKQNSSFFLLIYAICFQLLTNWFLLLLLLEMDRNFRCCLLKSLTHFLSLGSARLSINNASQTDLKELNRASEF